jgi:hypothetical protein
MKFVFFFLSFFLTGLMSTKVYCQNQNKNILEKITNSSGVIHYSYFPALGLDSTGKKICEQVGRDDLIEMLKCLTDTTKVLVFSCYFIKQL